MKLTRQRQKAMFARIFNRGFKTDKEKRFVKLIKDEFAKQPDSVKIAVKAIFLAKTKKGDDFKAFTTKDKEIEVRFAPQDTSGFSKVAFIHELEHIWFFNKQKKNPELIKDYANKIGNLKPFSLNLELIKLDLDQDIKNKVKRPLIKGTNFDSEYVDEIHSETIENVTRRKLGMPDVNLKTEQHSLFNEPAFKKAQKAYLELHKTGKIK